MITPRVSCVATAPTQHGLSSARALRKPCRFGFRQRHASHRSQIRPATSRITDARYTTRARRRDAHGRRGPQISMQLAAGLHTSPTTATSHHACPPNTHQQQCPPMPTPKRRLALGPIRSGRAARGLSQRPTRPIHSRSTPGCSASQHLAGTAPTHSDVPAPCFQSLTSSAAAPRPTPSSPPSALRGRRRWREGWPRLRGWLPLQT